MKEIPMIIGGKTCGQVQLQRQGAYILCTGQARGQHGLVRLWLHGKGESGYLGVLQPDGTGGGTLRKKFSLADFARLPDPITHCSNEEQQTVNTAEQPRPEDVLWVPLGDGTLTGRIGARQYMAFPAERVRLPRGAEGLLRQIEGRQYVIFPC